VGNDLEMVMHVQMPYGSGLSYKDMFNLGPSLTFNKGQKINATYETTRHAGRAGKHSLVIEQGFQLCRREERAARGKIEVDPQTEGDATLEPQTRIRKSREIREKRRTRHDASGNTFSNPAVDLWSVAEIVCVQDQRNSVSDSTV